MICCVIYSYAVTGIGQAVFADEANGSIVERNGKPVGSTLIGQAFTAPKYFWSRPSATGPMPNNVTASSVSNQGLLSPVIDALKGRIDALKAADSSNAGPIPVDLATGSAYKAGRIARERKLKVEEMRGMIDRQSERRLLSFLSQPRVNVLAPNLALDRNHPIK